MKTKSIFLLLTILILLFPKANAQNISQPVNALLDSLATIYLQDSIPTTGIVLGVSTEDTTFKVFKGGKYYADKSDLDKNTLFEIGSVTKLYTAYIFASLEQEGKINRQDLLSKYLPDSIKQDKIWAEKIRLVDLATHTSGLAAYDKSQELTPLEGFDENDPFGIFTTPMLLKLLQNTDSIPSYGKVIYSNFGIGLLAYTMEKATNEKFEVLFEKYIRKELGLSSTFLKLPENQVQNLAIPHRAGEPMPLINLADLSPAGSIKTTLSDLIGFLNVHTSSEKHQKIVNSVLANQLPHAETPVGFAWGIYSINDTSVFFHNGGTYGSSSIVIIIPQKKISIAILANDITQNLTGYAIQIATLLTQK